MWPLTTPRCRLRSMFDQLVSEDLTAPGSTYVVDDDDTLASSPCVTIAASAARSRGRPSSPSTPSATALPAQVRGTRDIGAPRWTRVR